MSLRSANNKCGKGLEIIVAWLPFKHERMLLLVWVIFSQHDLERNWVLPKLPSDFSFKLRIDQGRKHIKAENICSEKIRSLFSCLLSLPAALATDAQTHNGWATDAQIDESGFTKFVLLKPWSQRNPLLFLKIQASNEIIWFEMHKTDQRTPRRT